MPCLGRSFSFRSILIIFSNNGILHHATFDEIIIDALHGKLYLFIPSSRRSLRLGCAVWLVPNTNNTTDRSVSHHQGVSGNNNRRKQVGT